MRKIKFRAWDKEEKTFIPAHRGLITEYRDIDGFEYPTIQKNDEYENVVLMQYTGLKDKNGKEIYEGDIVKAEDGIWAIEFGLPHDGTMISLVSNSRGEMSLEFAENVYALGETEKIGNIYENPELLK